MKSQHIAAGVENIPITHDGTGFVDTKGVCVAGTGKIEGGQHTFMEQESMAEITTNTTTTSAAVAATKKKAPGLTFKRFFTRAGVSPYDELEWELRTAQITDAQGGVSSSRRTSRFPKTGR